MEDRQVILITGASRGIGRAMAEHFTSAGWMVAGCSRGASDLTAPNYRHFQADVSDEASVKNLFATIRKDFNRLDVLINNAGVASMNHSLLMPLDSARSILDTNFTGTFLFSREAAKLMQKRKYGRILNLTSVAVPLRLEGESVYAASKAAVEELTRILARELADLGITVNAIGPTPVETDLIRGIPPEKMKALLEKQAIKRFGRMEDILNLVEFLVRPESNFITGQIIYLGGVS